jgi:hypothetical protein
MANEEIVLKISNCKNNYIVLGQEPYTYARDWCGIPKTIRKHTPTEVNFRTSILHSPDLYIYNVPEFTSRDITTCIWKTKNQTRSKIYLLSVYWDGTIDVPPIEFRQALDFLKNNQKDFIIGIDTNAHSQLWCSVNNRNRFIRRIFAKRKLTQTSHIVQYCRVLPDLALLYGPKIGGPR